MTQPEKPLPINETMEVDVFLHSKEHAEAVEAGDSVRRRIAQLRKGRALGKSRKRGKKK